MQWLRTILPVIGLLAGGPAGAASFACTATSTSVERAICTDPRLSEADTLMASLFAQALTAVAAPDDLRRDQRHWIAAVRNKATSDDALRSAYAARIADLRDVLAGAPAAPPAVPAGAAGSVCVMVPHEAGGACKVESEGTVANAPGPPLRYQLQSYGAGEGWNSDRASVAFFADAAGKPRVLQALGMPGSHYGTPEIVASSSGPLLYLPGTAAGTGIFPDHALLVWRNNAWNRVDIDGWLNDLARRLPKGLTANKGIYPDWARMTAATSLWRMEDPNCCPKGGSATLRLALEGTRLVLVSIALHRP